MPERKTIINNQTLTYEGLVSMQGIYRELRNFLVDRGYQMYERDHREQVFPEGKEIVIKMLGDTKISDYAKILWEVDFEFTNVKEVVVEKEGQKVRMHQCKFFMKTHTWLETHYDNSLEQRAFVFFVRTLIDKFVIKNYLHRAEKRAQKEYALFEHTAKRFLNMERF